MNEQDEVSEEHNDFKSVMTLLGEMIAACSYMERTFDLLLLELVSRSAKTVKEKQRRFPEIVTLAEELFEEQVSDANARAELRAIGKDAKEFYKKRNEHVHSVWYMAPGVRNMPSAVRIYKDQDTKTVAPSDLTSLKNRFGECTVRIWELANRCFPH
jgi:hypothetical protein